eukprot:11661213-Ditylum_brightwellii.AAC.1
MVKRRLKDRKGDLAAVIKNIKHCEEMKQDLKQMKPITKGISGRVVKELLVPNSDALSCPATYDEVLESLQFKHAQPLAVLDDQDEVMSALVRRNKLHLHQAYDTPFAQKDMQDYIG